MEGGIPERIEAVVFDVGGVLVAESSGVIRRQLGEWAGLPEGLIPGHFELHEAALQTGIMSVLALFNRLAAEHPCPGAGMLLEKYLELYAGASRVDSAVRGFISASRRVRPVACLTNTEIEVARFNHRRHLFDCFDKIFVSCDIGLRKPDPAVYHHVSMVLGIPPAGLLCIDDNPGYVAAARKQGWQGLVFNGLDSLCQGSEP